MNDNVLKQLSLVLQVLFQYLFDFNNDILTQGGGFYFWFNSSLIKYHCLWLFRFALICFIQRIVSSPMRYLQLLLPTQKKSWRTDPRSYWSPIKHMPNVHISDQISYRTDCRSVFVIFISYLTIFYQSSLILTFKQKTKASRAHVYFFVYSPY